VEAVLGIGRTAKDKLRRVVEALDKIYLDSIPQGLRQSVEAFFARED